MSADDENWTQRRPGTYYRTGHAEQRYLDGWEHSPQLGVALGPIGRGECRWQNGDTTICSSVTSQQILPNPPPGAPAKKYPRRDLLAGAREGECQLAQPTGHHLSTNAQPQPVNNNYELPERLRRRIRRVRRR